MSDPVGESQRPAGGTNTKVSTVAAMRARDVSRPTRDQLDTAVEHLDRRLGERASGQSATRPQAGQASSGGRSPDRS